MTVNRRETVGHLWIVSVRWLEIDLKSIGRTGLLSISVRHCLTRLSPRLQFRHIFDTKIEPLIALIFTLMI